jgi:phosphoglycerol transferase MdoB-like AlkP superfamily enzyme
LSYRSLTEEAPELDFPSLPAILKKLDYRTSFFSSADWNWQNSDRFIKYRGFDQVEDYTDIACAEQYRIDETVYSKGGGIDDGCIADRFSSWLGEAPDQAFASVLWTVQGHYPYYFTGNEIDYGVNNFSFNRYLNALRHDDELVGEVLDQLRTRGLDSTTLVVVVGDHGEAFGQHGQTGHAGGVYEENLRVPLYFINPTLFNGTWEDDMATMKDIPTTALSLLGIPAPPAWQGRNLLTTDAHEVFSFAPWTGHYFGYRNRRFKYIFNEVNQGLEVYDLINDPKETNDLSAQHPQDSIAVARLRIAAWAQHHRDFIANITQYE